MKPRYILIAWATKQPCFPWVLESLHFLLACTLKIQLRSMRVLAHANGFGSPGATETSFGLCPDGQRARRRNDGPYAAMRRTRRRVRCQPTSLRSSRCSKSAKLRESLRRKPGLQHEQSQGRGRALIPCAAPQREPSRSGGGGGGGGWA